MKNIYTIMKCVVLVLTVLVVAAIVGTIMCNMVLPADMRWLTNDDIVGLFFAGLTICILLCLLAWFLNDMSDY